MPAFDPSLASVEQAREWCKVAGTSSDLFLSELVRSASLFAESETGRKLRKRTYASGGDEPALVFDGSGTCALHVRQFPILSVSKVEFLVQVGPELWEERDLSTHPVGIDDLVGDLIYFRTLVFPRGYRNVRVSMVAGYDPVPYNLSVAIREIVQAQYLNKDKQLAGVAAKTFEGQTTHYLNEAMPKQALLLLSQFNYGVSL